MTPSRCTVALRIRPGAKTERITSTAAGFELHVKPPPHEGKANSAACEALARFAGVAKSKVQLVRGLRSRDKIFVIDGLAEAAVLDRLMAAARQ